MKPKIVKIEDGYDFWKECQEAERRRLSDSGPSAGSVSSLVEQKDAQIKALREQNQFLESKLYTYLIEIDKANKGLRRLSRRLKKKQSRGLGGKVSMYDDD